LVMTVKGLDFIDTVEYLRTILPRPERELSDRLGRANATIRRSRR
jgi:hypothetical protein